MMGNFGQESSPPFWTMDSRAWSGWQGRYPYSELANASSIVKCNILGNESVGEAGEQPGKGIALSRQVIARGWRLAAHGLQLTARGKP